MIHISDAKAAEAAQSAYYDPNRPQCAYVPPPAYYVSTTLTNPVGSGQGSMAGCCKYGDERAGSGTTELLGWLVGRSISQSVSHVCSQLATPLLRISNFGKSLRSIKV
jgi:hypothetical protein